MNKKFLKAMGIRIIKTMAETAIALIPAAATLEQVDWMVVLSTSALSGLVCFLTCIKGLPEVSEDGE